MIKILGWIGPMSILLFSVLSAFGNEKTTVLQCVSNSIANRDYHFAQNQWVDGKDNPSQEFKTGSKSKPNDLVMRDKIFSRIDTDKPIVKSMTPKTTLTESETVEFVGSVLERTKSLITIEWKNPYQNKLWIATIDLQHKKAVVNHIYEGATSFGVNVETLDCK